MSEPARIEPRTDREVRYNDDGTVDEVIGRSPRLVHLEQMDTGAWWMRIDMFDGTALVLNFYSKRRIRLLVEED